MRFEIAIARPVDIPEMVGLLNQLFTLDAEFVPDPEKQETGLSLIVNNPNIGEILILKFDGKVIGMVSLLFTISTAMGGKVAVLEDMIVTREFRSRGLGSKLLGAAIDFAQKRECLRITLLTDSDNKVAASFYKKSGFEKSSMVPMRLLFRK